MGREHIGIKEKLITRDGNCCSICGEPLNTDKLFIDHIHPIALGGQNDLVNLQLLCLSCNHAKGGKLGNVLGYQFEEYVKSLLIAHPDYSNIRSGSDLEPAQLDADIVFDRHKGEKSETIISELKVASSYTLERINAIIQHLGKYKQCVPTAKVAFIFPGELPEKYMAIMHDEGIEIWDRSFLDLEFKEQIQAQEPSIFRNLILPASIGTESAQGEADKYLGMIERLKKCPSGKPNWGKYQKMTGEILEMLFCPELSTPISQSSDHYHKNRRDFVIPNYSQSDIWHFLRDRYCADYIVVDAKNSGKVISKDDVLQIGHYLKRDGTGLFGIIIARKGVGQAAEYSLREMWLYENKMIIVLNDDDIEQMLLEKKNANDPAKILLKKIEDFRLSV